MEKIKVAIAQINYRPAFFISDIDATVEPNPRETTISQLSYNGSSKLKEEIKREYISWIRNKVIAITKYAVDNNVDLLVFPEYSIPPEILCDIVTVLSNTKMFVVAGTHMVTNKKINLPDNYPSIKDIMQFAMCPVLSSKGIHDFTFKKHRSSAEICSLKTPNEKTNEVINLGEFQIQIKICIDAISNTEVFAFDKDNRGILVIPSLSYTIDPFNAVATYLRFNEIPVLYSNFSDVGGSAISASFSKTDKHWFLDSMKSKPLGKDVEAVVISTFDLDKMFTVSGTVNTEAGAVINDVVCVFYSKYEQHKQTISAINAYNMSLLDKDFLDLKKVSNISLMANKIRFVEQMQNNGLIDYETAESIFKYVTVNDVTYKDLYAKQIIRIFNSLTAGTQFIFKDDKILPNLQVVSGYYSKINSGNIDLPQNESIFDDEKLFYGRDSEIAELSGFFHSSDKVILVHGLRGIGKTKLVQNIETQIIPLKALWEVNYLQLAQGIGFDLLFDELSNILDIPYIDKSKISTDSLIDKIFNVINNGKERIIILDDIHQCTEPNGNFVDSVLGDFICKFIERTKENKKLKLVLVSNRKVIDIDHIVDTKLKVTRLKDEFIRNIINYCYQKITASITSIIIEPNIYKIIYGNPLAAILISQLLIDNKWDKFEETADVFNHFQEGLIKNLLDEINLSEDEVKLLKIVSVTKGKLEIQFINENYPYLLSSVDSLINRFLLESDGESIIIHPLFQEHYYSLIDFASRTTYHKQFADYYENLVLKSKNKKKPLNPNILSNTIFHLGGSLQISKFSYYKNKYVEELKPIADTLYKDKDHKQAILYYRKIYDTVGINRTDILIKMAQCYVYEDNIPEAEHFFKLACEQKPKAAYLWAEYAIALTSKKENIKRALECVKAAKEIQSNNLNYFEWELAKIKFAEARAYRYVNIKKAAELYLEVCEIEKTSTYYLCICAEFLYKYVNKPLALEKFKLAEKIDAKYHYVIRLKENFAKSLDDETICAEEASCCAQEEFFD